MSGRGRSEAGKAIAPGGVRARMVEGTVRLLATKGVEGTSFAEVLAATSTPRGSIYHHFPGGKPELLHAALDLASQRGLAAMEATRGQSAAAVVERFLGLWRELLDRSRLTAGCAVVAVTVAAGDDDLLDHAGTIFRTWTERLAELCAVGGMNPEPARRLAVTVIAATEGAVALCRAERSREPFEDVSATLLSLSTTQPPHLREQDLEGKKHRLRSEILGRATAAPSPPRHHHRAGTFTGVFTSSPIGPVQPTGQHVATLVRRPGGCKIVAVSPIGRHGQRGDRRQGAQGLTGGGARDRRGDEMSTRARKLARSVPTGGARIASRAP